MDEHTVLRRRRLFVVIPLLLVGFIGSLVVITSETTAPQPTVPQVLGQGSTARQALDKLAVRGRAPSTGYSRDKFGNGWQTVETCDTRNKILARDMTNVVFKNKTCVVESGIVQDPYTAKTIDFKRGTGSSAVQIDHVSALGDTWQKGAQNLTPNQRETLANDPLELLAVDGPANMQKSDGDAATWLPSNKSFRCQYVARQIAVKQKYNLWVTTAEHDAMANVLQNCPNQALPIEKPPATVLKQS